MPNSNEAAQILDRNNCHKYTSPKCIKSQSACSFTIKIDPADKLSIKLLKLQNEKLFVHRHILIHIQAVTYAKQSACSNPERTLCNEVSACCMQRYTSFSPKGSSIKIAVGNGSRSYSASQPTEPRSMEALRTTDASTNAIPAGVSWLVFVWERPAVSFPSVAL